MAPPRGLARLACAAIALAAPAAHGHGLATSQLRLRIRGAQLEGEWEIQLRDVRLALGAAGDDRLGSYLAGRLSLTADGLPCPLQVAAPAAWRRDQDHFTLGLVARCPAEPNKLAIACDVLFDVDRVHRAYFSVEDERVTHVGVFRHDLRAVTLDVHHFHAFAGFLEFVREGVVHIWTGFDHLLFLLALLLPASLVRAGGRWSPRRGLGPTGREVVKVVTAFTIAHSVTLILAFLGVVTFAARAVEVAIAVSVFAAAWNNLRPFLPGRSWIMALLFGLIHGLGFAGALRNLALPTRSRGLALAGFNVGVELGQLVIVGVTLPLLYAASRRPFYPRLVMGVGSLVIAWLAVLWTIQRGLGLPVLAFG